MRSKIKFIAISCLLLTVILLATSCSKDPAPFNKFNKNGYNFSVKYDANGGIFTTDVETIIDTYDLDKYETNGDGNKELRLFAPDAAERGNQRYTVQNGNYYLAGWYTERNEVKDSDGNVTGYTYGGLWDFENDRLSVKADKKYDSKNPEITLYAAWVSFEYEIYSYDKDGNPVLVETLYMDPLGSTEITLPALDEKTGLVGAPNSFPKLDGKLTYDKIYADADKTEEITDAKITHSGSFNKETATVENGVKKLYYTTLDGVYYMIDTVEKLTKNPYADAHYTLTEDLDFDGKYWPAAFTTSAFTGTFDGNGHTIKNVSITQNNNQNRFFGLFGQVSGGADIKDITFESITSTIKSYSNYTSASFGIFAGEIDDGAQVSGITLKDSRLVIEKGLNLIVAVQSKDPKFGLAYATGESDGITFSTENVTVEFAGTSTNEYEYTLDEHGCFTLTAK